MIIYYFKGNLSNSSKLVVVDVAPLKYDTRKSFSAIVNALCDLDISSSKSRKDIESDFAKLLPVSYPLCNYTIYLHIIHYYRMKIHL